MAEPDPRAVLVVPERHVAELIAAWLTDKGFPAEADITPMTTTADPLTGATEAGTAEYRVLVTNPEHKAPAKELIEQESAGIAELREREAKRAARTGMVEAVCEECGKSSQWEAAEMGKTQVCPHCTKYMDIPDPDDDWAGVDFGEEEAENEAERGNT